MIGTATNNVTNQILHKSKRRRTVTIKPSDPRIPSKKMLAFLDFFMECLQEVAIVSNPIFDKIILMNNIYNLKNIEIEKKTTTHIHIYMYFFNILIL